MAGRLLTFFVCFGQLFFGENPSPPWTFPSASHVVFWHHWPTKTSGLQNLVFSGKNGPNIEIDNIGCTLDTLNLHYCNNSFEKKPKKTFLSFRQILVDLLCVHPQNFNSSPLKIDGVEGRSFPFRKATFQGQTVKLCCHVERAGFQRALLKIKFRFFSWKWLQLRTTRTMKNIIHNTWQKTWITTEQYIGIYCIVCIGYELHILFWGGGISSSRASCSKVSI